MKSNFSSLRFKCLVCYDYDLCASCRDNGATSSRHTVNHPMQCIMTRADLSKSFVHVSSLMISAVVYVHVLIVGASVRRSRESSGKRIRPGHWLVSVL